MNRFALALLLSTTCLYQGSILPTSWLFFPALLVVALSLKYHHYIVAGLFSGASLICVHSYFFELQRLPTELIGVDIEVIGRVSQIPRINNSTVMFNFVLDRAISSQTLASIPKNLRLSCYKCTLTLRSGETWRLTVRLKPGRGHMNPGGFDYEKWLRAKGVDAVGYVRTKSENRRLDSSIGVLGLRDAFARTIQSLELTPGAKALTRALALGDGSELGHEFWGVLRKTGTSHLMVISGLHITLIAATVAGLFSLLWRPLTYLSVFKVSRRSFSFSMGVIAAIVYAGLAGFTVPTVRALIMLIAYLVFLHTRRHMGSLKPLAVSLVVVLVFQPYSPLMPGFWLSFFAVAFIHFYLTTRAARESWFFAYVHWHFALTIGMAPITVLFFGYFSPLAMLANFVAVPLVSMLVVPMVLLGAGLLFVFEAIGIMVLEFANGIMSVLMQGLSLLAEYEFAQIWLSGVTIWHCLIFLTGVLIWLVPFGWRIRWLAIPLVFSIFILDVKTLQPGEFEVKVLDVGQGLSVLVSTQKHHLLFDTGGRIGRGRTMAQSVVLPMLKYEGVGRLDKLVISHPDSDHSVGLGDITAGLNVDRVITEQSFSDEIMADEYCELGVGWEWDGVRFEYLNKPGSHLRSKNDRSCVLMVSSGKTQVLLPGDIEEAGERQLLSSLGRTGVELIVAPHHGSRTSSTEELLQRVRPRYVAFSVGWRNRYGFPNTDVVGRYETVGADVYRTDLGGMLAFRFDREGLTGEVIVYRDKFKEFWRIESLVE